MKKAQGLPLNIVVLAAIALLVLVILSVVTIGRVGLFQKGVSEVETKNLCSASGTQRICSSPDPGAGYKQVTGKFQDCSADEKCWEPLK